MTKKNVCENDLDETCLGLKKDLASNKSMFVVTESGMLLFGDCVAEPTKLELEILNYEYMVASDADRKRWIGICKHNLKKRLRYIKKNKIDVRPSRDFAGLP